MRLVLTYEDHTSDLPFFFLLGSIKWSSEGVPLTWGSDWSNRNAVLGRVDDIRREDDGAITCAFKPSKSVRAIKDDIFKTSDVSIYANEVKAENVAGLQVVHSCMLRAVYTTFKQGVPWNCIIEGD